MSSALIAGGASAAPVTLTVNVAVGTCKTPDANGTCTVAAGTAPSIRSPSAAAASPHGPASTNNSATDPTPVQQAGAISGRVWQDINHDRLDTTSEPGVSGILVEVTDATGAWSARPRRMPVATTVSTGCHQAQATA